MDKQKLKDIKHVGTANGMENVCPNSRNHDLLADVTSVYKHEEISSFKIDWEMKTVLTGS